MHILFKESNPSLDSTSLTKNLKENARKSKFA